MMYGYDYGYGYDSYDSAANAIGIFAGVGVVMWIIGMAVAVFSVISMWKLFKKAGKPGWASIVPIYNMIVMIEIAELPMWYIALFFVPFANIYAMFKIYIEIAHKFGKSTGFGVGMVFLNIIFIPMLAFGKAEYKAASQDVSSINNSNLVNNSNLQGQFTPNANFNMQNNNPQVNVMDVNSGMGVAPMNDINMQNNGSMFQPAGNVNNNIYGNDINSMSVSQNNTVDNLNNTNNMAFNNNVMVENVPTMPEQNVMSNQGMNMVSQPVNVVNNEVPVMNTVPVMNEQVAMPVQNPVSDVNTQQLVNNMKKMCPHCANQVEFDAKFCNNCGNSL